jgi:hypothetical protein
MSCGKQDHYNGDVGPIGSSVIIGSTDWKEIGTLASSNQIRQAASPVGDIDIPAVGSRCTGFLISADVFLTNHHCITKRSDAVGVTVSFNHQAGVAKASIEKFDCSTFIGNDEELDFALLKCAGSPGLKYGIAQLDGRELSPSESIYVVQQNCDYYSDASCDWTKKYAVGKVVDVADEITHDADTLGGSSGSPVFSLNSHKVVALHHAGLANLGRGRGSENYAVPMSRITDRLERDFASVLGTGGSSGGSRVGNSDGNDSFDVARALSSKVRLSGKVANSVDVDFYSFKLTQAKTVQVQLSFSHASGDLDISLYDSQKRLVAKSEGSSNLESIQKLLASGTYYIKIYGYKGAAGEYSLTIN